MLVVLVVTVTTFLALISEPGRRLDRRDDLALPFSSPRSGKSAN
jgi:hypothetical protein